MNSRLPPSRFPAKQGGILRKLIYAILFLSAVAVLSWMLFLPTLLEKKLTQRTGFPVSVDRANGNPFTGTFHASRVHVHNPPEFLTADFLEVESFALDFTVRSYWQDRLVFPYVSLRLQSLTIVRNRDGTLNIYALRDAISKDRDQPAGTHSSTRRDYMLERVNLFIGDVLFIDHSRGQASPRRYSMNLEREYRDISDLSSLLMAVMMDLTTAGLGGLLPDLMQGPSPTSPRGLLQDLLERGRELLRGLGSEDETAPVSPVPSTE